MSADEPRAYRRLVEALMSDDPEVSEGQMMGMPALKLSGKLFGGRAGGDLVVRIGRDRAAELVSAGRASAFDPSGRGRPMKDWAVVPHPDEDWLTLATEAKRLLAGGA